MARQEKPIECSSSFCAGFRGLNEEETASKSSLSVHKKAATARNGFRKSSAVFFARALVRASSSAIG